MYLFVERVMIIAGTIGMIALCGSAGVARGGITDEKFPEAITGMTVDGKGFVYATDVNCDSVFKLDSSGGVVASWGGKGKKSGQFRAPLGIATDAKNRIYIVDSGNRRVQVFNSHGIHLSQWSIGSEMQRKPGLLGPIAVSGRGEAYVSNGDGRVQKFDSTGRPITGWNLKLTQPNGMSWPRPLAVDRRGNLFVADPFNGGVQKFDLTGRLVSKWGLSPGDGGQIRFITALAVDNQGNLYTLTETGRMALSGSGKKRLEVDGNTDRVEKFASTGQYIGKLTSYGSGAVELHTGMAIVIGPNGYIYVADCNLPAIVSGDVVEPGGCRILLLDASGRLVQKWQAPQIAR